MLSEGSSVKGSPEDKQEKCQDFMAGHSGTLHQSRSGEPHLVLYRGYLNIPPTPNMDLGWGIPHHQLDGVVPHHQQDGYPPPGPGMGIPPPGHLGWGTPSPPPGPGMGYPHPRQLDGVPSPLPGPEMG